MKKIINILLRMLDCITLRGIVEKPKTYTPDRVKYVEDTQDYIQIPISNNQDLTMLKITINDEVYDFKSGFGDVVKTSTIATKPLATEEDFKNWRMSLTPFSPPPLPKTDKQNLPAVYKLDNGDYDVYIRINGEDTFGYCGHVIESNEPKNYPVGRYSERWNLRNMSIVENYGKEE